MQSQSKNLLTISTVAASLALLLNITTIYADSYTNSGYTNPNTSTANTANNAAANTYSPGSLLDAINYWGQQISEDISNGFSALSQETVSLSTYISNVVSSGVQTSSNLMFTISPDLKSTMSTSYSQGVAMPVASGQAFVATNNQLNQVFNVTPYNTAALTQINDLADIAPIPGQISSTSTESNVVTANSTTNNALAPFNMGSLLTPNAYSTQTEQQNAQNYISYLSYQSVPYVNIPANFFANKYPSVQAYRAFLGTYAALQSIGLSNLNELYAERQPQSGLGTLAGFDAKRPNASVQQVEHYSIDQRGLNPQWYASMENAPPATIQRETLYTLAAIQVELYQNNQLMQRMLATESAMELTQTQLQVRPQLRKLANRAESSVQNKQDQSFQFDVGQ